MRRITVIGMIILGLVALPLIAAAKPEPPKKVEICHFDDDGESHTIEVSEKAVQAHEAHGDNIDGACDETSETELPAVTATFAVQDIVCGSGFFEMYCSLTLDASGSTFDIVDFEWSYANSSQSGFATGPNPTIELLLKGSDTEVTLTVTDPFGQTAEATQIIKILEPVTP